jgi:aryl-alcohol dehydrogenase-like predicted oxidoreductase
MKTAGRAGDRTPKVREGPKPTCSHLVTVRGRPRVRTRRGVTRPGPDKMAARGSDRRGGATVLTRRIGELEVSVAGLGCNNFGMRIDQAGAHAVVDAALDAGVTHFDTADLYGGGKSEEFLGAALGSHRGEVVVATKFGMRPPPKGLSGGDPTWVVRALDESLERLGTDHVDLYWLHQPDLSTPIGETLAALHRLVEAGKVRELGCSNFSATQLDHAAAAATELGVKAFVTVQNEYSLLHREPEAEVLPACARHRLSFVPYFPLASGLLTGKYTRGEDPPEGTRLARWPSDRVEGLLNDERFDVVEELVQFAAQHGHALLELALSWLTANPLVASVIAGATTPEQVRDNAAATTAWELTAEERAEVDLLVGHPHQAA